MWLADGSGRVNTALISSMQRRQSCRCGRCVVEWAAAAAASGVAALSSACNGWLVRDLGQFVNLRHTAPPLWRLIKLIRSPLSRLRFVDWILNASHWRQVNHSVLDCDNFALLRRPARTFVNTRNNWSTVDNLVIVVAIGACSIISFHMQCENSAFWD